jgi:hypothetical protein
MDALDEQQMIDEQKGHVIDQYFYSFKVAGREIIGCSWAGIKFIASKMASLGHPIAVTDLVIEEGQDSYKAKAKAKDLATGEERWGVAEQAKVDEKGRRNMFAYPIAASKAQRNALRAFISEVVIQEGYREWRKRQATVSAEPAKNTAAEPEGKQERGEGVESTGITVTPQIPTGQANDVKLGQATTPGQTKESVRTTPPNLPQLKPLPPQGVWSSSPTLSNLLKESDRSIQKDNEIFAVMTIREYDDGHDEFLVTPKNGYLVNTGPMGFLRNRILEPQKARAVQRNSPNPFLYEIRESNNGLLKEIWISCKRYEGKDLEVNLITPLIWTFNHVLHPDLDRGRDKSPSHWDLKG